MFRGIVPYLLSRTRIFLPLSHLPFNSPSSLAFLHISFENVPHLPYTLTCLPVHHRTILSSQSGLLFFSEGNNNSTTADLTPIIDHAYTKHSLLSSFLRLLIGRYWNLEITITFACVFLVSLPGGLGSVWSFSVLSLSWRPLSSLSLDVEQSAAESSASPFPTLFRYHDIYIICFHARAITYRFVYIMSCLYACTVMFAYFSSVLCTRWYNKYFYVKVLVIAEMCLISKVKAVRFLCQRRKLYDLCVRGESCLISVSKAKAVRFLCQRWKLFDLCIREVKAVRFVCQKWKLFDFCVKGENCLIAVSEVGSKLFDFCVKDQNCLISVSKVKAVWFVCRRWELFDFYVEGENCLISVSKVKAVSFLCQRWPLSWTG